MQNAFVKEGAGHAWIPEAASVVPNINALAHALRAAGGLVVWLKNTGTQGSRGDWPHFFWGLFGDVQSTGELVERLNPVQASEAAE